MEEKDIILNKFKNSIFKIADKYRLQPWYNTNYYRFVDYDPHEFMNNFGYNCVFQNIITGETFTHWDRTMDKLSDEDSKQILR